MQCKICQTTCNFIFNAPILNKYQIPFFKCKNCGFIQCQKAFWLDESYTEAINASDTGILSRNLFLQKTISTLAYFLFGKKTKILDWGGGYGILVRMLRDIGFSTFYYDAYAQNIFAKPFTFCHQTPIDLIVSFEVFEHLEDPQKTLESLLKISKNILFSTELIPSEVPPFNGEQTWWYYGFSHGQHISFYSYKSLEVLAKKHQLHFYSYRNIHLFTTKKFPNFIFKSIVILSKIGLHLLPKFFMQSKTQEDSKIILQN